MPKISIIVPVYKAEQYLPCCIDSILAQTFTDFELILVDDGSPDNSGKICDEYAEKDSRIRVIHQENSGVSAARNAGLDAASGTYIMFCDSDDWVDPDWCECLYEAILDKDAVMAVCGYKNFSENGIYNITKRLPNNQCVSVKDFYSIYMYMCSSWNKIFIRDYITSHSITFSREISYGEDARFVQNYLRLHRDEDKIKTVINTPYNYRDCVAGLSKPSVDKYWKTERELYSITKDTIFLFNKDCEKYLHQLNDHAFRVIEVSNYYLFKSEKKLVEKLKMFRQIIKSEVFLDAISSERVSNFDRIHRFLFVHRWVFALYLFYSLRIK